MSEFKVGDSVKLKEGLNVGELYGYFKYHDRMYFCGITKIITVFKRGYHLEVFGKAYFFTDNMLDFVLTDPLSLSEIIDRNYKATVRRSQIKPETNIHDFVAKLEEEVKELKDSIKPDDSYDRKELADVALVCFAAPKHENYDLLKIMEEKTIYNENRKD